MAERWETVEAIRDARRQFEAALPGWRYPAAYGVGVLDAAGAIEFLRVNGAEHPLPAVVLATVCGHRSGSASYRLRRDDLSQAVDLLEPAEACTAYEHPNLWAWRGNLPNLTEDSQVIAVFADDWDTPTGDEYVAALRKAADR